MVKFDLDLEDLKLQENEVEKVKFISIKDLREEAKDENKYVSHGNYYRKIINAVKKNRLEK